MTAKGFDLKLGAGSIREIEFYTSRPLILRAATPRSAAAAPVLDALSWPADRAGRMTA